MSGQEKAKETDRQRRRSHSLLPAPVEAVIRFGFSLTLVLSEYNKLRQSPGSGSRAASAGSDAADHVTASALLTAVDDAVRHSSFPASSQSADDEAICREFAEGTSETSLAESLPSWDCADDDSSCPSEHRHAETLRQCDDGAAATTTASMCPPREGTTSTSTGPLTTDFASTTTTPVINPLRDGTTTPSTTATTTNITVATTTAAAVSSSDGTTPLAAVITTDVAAASAAISLPCGEASTTATLVIPTTGVSELPGGSHSVSGGSTSDPPAGSDPNRDATHEPSLSPTPAVQHSHSARDRSSERRERTSARDDDDSGERSRQVKRLRVLRAENRRLKARRMCRQCLERPVSLTLLPCGHFLFCQECGSTFTACPMCRKTILADVRTFVS